MVSDVTTKPPDFSEAEYPGKEGSSEETGCSDNMLRTLRMTFSIAGILRRARIVGRHDAMMATVASKAPQKSP